MGVSNLSLWLRVPGKVVFVPFSGLEIKRHYVPTIQLFLPTLATSLYTMLDKTLIGVIIPSESIEVLTKNGTIVAKLSDVENGFYEQADKIVKMSLTIVTSLGSVMIARNSNEVAKGHGSTVINNVYKAQSFIFYIAVPMCLGLAAISDNFCPWFFGPGYDKVPYLIMILSPLFLIIGLSNVIGMQYLLPMKLDKRFTMSICFGAAFNLILNVPLIYYLHSYGAAIATVGAETIVTIMMYRMAKGEISFLKMIRENWKSLVAGCLMFVILMIVKKFFTSSVINTVILLICGALSYVLALVCIKDEFIREFGVIFFKKIKRGA
jgi:O-antigen/teichoic acid export membrane protein